MATQPAFTTAFRAEDLPDPQRLALEALLRGMTHPEAARHARTSERTLRRWLRDPLFLAALRQARCDAWLETTTALQQLNRSALDALQRVLDSDSPRAQVYAAKTVLLLTMKALDAEAMCGRIAQAEADVEAHLNGGTPPTFYSDPEDENEDPDTGSDPTLPPLAGTPQGVAVREACSANGATPYQPGATPSEPYGGGPATNHRPSHGQYASAPEGDLHAAGNSAARDDTVSSATVRERPTHQGRSERATITAKTGQIRPKPDTEPRQHPTSRTLAARHLAAWAAGLSPEKSPQRREAHPPERQLPWLATAAYPTRAAGPPPSRAAAALAALRRPL